MKNYKRGKRLTKSDLLKMHNEKVIVEHEFDDEIDTVKINYATRHDGFKDVLLDEYGKFFTLEDTDTNIYEYIEVEKEPIKKIPLTRINTSGSDVHKTAEELFRHNVGSKIKASLITDKDESNIFEGILTEIICNQFFIVDENDKINMFRYEDLRYLCVVNEKED